MPSLAQWFLATRPWSFTASLVAMTIGSALARRDAPLRFSYVTLCETLLAGFAAHCGGNLVNTYFDYVCGLDKPNTSGDRTMFEGKMKPNEILAFALSSLALSVVLGLHIGFGVIEPKARTDFLWLLIAGVSLAYCYTGEPLKLKYRAMGDIVIFLCFGPLIVLGSYIVHTSTFSWVPILYSIPMGLITEGILHVNNARDIEADRKAGALTLAQVLGLTGSYWFFVALFAVSYAQVGWMAWHSGQMLVAILPSLALALLPNLLQSFRAQKWSGLLEATAGFGFVFGTLLTIALLF